MVRAIYPGSFDPATFGHLDVIRRAAVSYTHLLEHHEKVIKEAEKLAAQQREAVPEKEVGFISVSVGDGMGDIFRDLGADYLIEGGQTMNPRCV